MAKRANSIYFNNEEIFLGPDIKDLLKIADASSNYSTTGHTHSSYLTSHQSLAGYSTTGHTHSTYLTAHQSLTGYSTVGHDHSDVYSAKNHNHFNEYSPLDHSHNDYYAEAQHVHNYDSKYSSVGHSHYYSAIGHTHSDYITSSSLSTRLSSYSGINHKHDDYYSLKEHTHDYSPSNHIHIEYKEGLNDIKGIYNDLYTEGTGNVMNVITSNTDYLNKKTITFYINSNEVEQIGGYVSLSVCRTYDKSDGSFGIYSPANLQMTISKNNDQYVLTVNIANNSSSNASCVVGDNVIYKGCTYIKLTITTADNVGIVSIPSNYSIYSYDNSITEIVNVYTKTEADSNFSSTGHTHSDYLTAHLSLSNYSTTGHTHAYSTNGHTHSTYLTAHQSLTGYSTTGHTHSIYLTSHLSLSNYSTTGHTHAYSTNGHTHSTYLTAHQSLDGYSTTGHTHSIYLTSHLSLSNYSTTGHTHGDYLLRSEYTGGGADLTDYVGDVSILATDTSILSTDRFYVKADNGVSKFGVSEYSSIDVSTGGISMESGTGRFNLFNKIYHSKTSYDLTPRNLSYVSNGIRIETKNYIKSTAYHVGIESSIGNIKSDYLYINTSNGIIHNGGVVLDTHNFTEYGLAKVQKLTQAQYDALESKDENTLYVIE